MTTTTKKTKIMKLEVLCNKRHDWDEESQSWVEAEVAIKPADFVIGNNFAGSISEGSSIMDYNVLISREEALLHVSAAELKELGYE